MKLFADSTLDDVVGTITNPLPQSYKSIEGPGGPILFFNNVLRLVFVVAGIYAFVNFIIAGFEYMSAAGDSKKLSDALSRIWYSLLGLIVIVASFALTAVVSQLFFGNPMYILNPTITGPK